MTVRTTRAPQRPHVRVNDKGDFSVSFAKELDSGELLTGTPTAVEQTTSDLTISNVVVSTAELTIKGITTALGKAIQGHVIGFQTGIEYDILVSADTDATPDAGLKNRLITIITDP